jgi:predicted outer membrane repeat protein
VTRIENSKFSSNVASSGSAVGCGYLGLCSTNAPASGGAIWSARALSLTNSSFSDNQAQAPGRGDLDGNGRGGAVASDVAITVNGGDFTGNQVTYGSGGALNALSVSIADGTFTKNTASGSGGAIAAETLTAIHISASENTANGSGGGAIAVVRDATIERSNIHDNSVFSFQADIRGVVPARTLAGGGAVRVIGKLTISATQVIGNSGSATVNIGYGGQFAATFVGGGIEAGSLDGSGITVASNQALGASFSSYNAALFGPSGGGGIASTGSVTLVNSTVVGNQTSADTLAFGSGVFATTLKLDQVTVANNANAPAIQIRQLTTYRSVVSAPAEQPACAGYPDPSSGRYNYALAASAYDWFDDASCALAGTGDHQTDASFALGPLADNGGPVPTLYPAPTSVLINQIPISACPVAVDARGVTRPEGPACDIGAVEASP